MELDADSCYAALKAHDRRFDGVFFAGVTSTGIYCRPVCRVRSPKRENLRFYGTSAAAEAEGYRACLRCRPELAPGNAAVDSLDRLVRSAVARIDAGYLNGHSVEDLAGHLGVSARHLRRSMRAELGIAPQQLAATRRLGMATQLLHDTALSVAEVAFAAGFQSVRRLNAVFKDRFGRAPGAIRRHARTKEGGVVRLRLSYREPFEFSQTLSFLAPRAIPGIEAIDPLGYRRLVSTGDKPEGFGWLRVTDDSAASSLRVEIPGALAHQVISIRARVRQLFDLDARPDVIDERLAACPRLRRRVRARPGLRVPGAFDPFELAVRAVLGQQISVRAASTLAGRLVRRFGAPLGTARAFPSPGALAQAGAAAVGLVGLPGARAKAIVALAEAIAAGSLDLEAEADPEATLAALLAVPGIGPWTAHYVALRALKWPDAFPSSDLGLRKALGTDSSRQTQALAARWRPWRSYAAMHLWHTPPERGPR